MDSFSQIVINKILTIDPRDWSYNYRDNTYFYILKDYVITIKYVTFVTLNGGSLVVTTLYQGTILDETALIYNSLDYADLKLYYDKIVATNSARLESIKAEFLKLLKG